MDRKHFAPRSLRKSVKHDRQLGPLRPRKAGVVVEPWLRLANLLPPLEDPPEVTAVLSRIRKLTGSGNLAKGRSKRDLRRVLESMRGHRLEETAIQSSLPNADDFMEKARAAGLAELVKLRPGTEKPALLELAQQVYFVLAGLVHRRMRTSISLVHFAYEIGLQRHRLVVRAWNPFTRFTEALNEIDASRLRRCAVCKKFFYAIRKDARCCSAEVFPYAAAAQIRWQLGAIQARAEVPDSDRASGRQRQESTPVDRTERGVTDNCAGRGHRSVTLTTKLF